MAGKLVAVCGATGQQGGAVVDALLRLGGYKVRALTRDPASNSSKKLADKGVEVMKADFEDPASLEAAFQGADAVFGVTDFFAGCGLDPAREIQQGKNMVDAAKKTGVGHFVWSTLEPAQEATKGILEPVNAGYTVPHFDTKAEVEKYLHEQLPGKGTALLTSFFLENMLPGAWMAPMKQPDGTFIMVFPVGTATLAYCSTADIGNVAAAIIAGGPGKFAGKTVPVAGDYLTLAATTEAVSKLTGKKVVPVAPPAEAWIEQAKAGGVPELAAKDLANMCLFYQHVDMTALRSLDATKAVYPQVLNLDAWLEKHKQAFLDATA
ncbi:hypothetical protein N2152v2_004142 [Parachlorella kessleri]